jgi:hypothetical protein
MEWLILAGIGGAVVLYAVLRLALALDAVRRNAATTDDLKAAVERSTRPGGTRAVVAPAEPPYGLSDLNNNKADGPGID